MSGDTAAMHESGRAGIPPCSRSLAIRRTAGRDPERTAGGSQLEDQVQFVSDGDAVLAHGSPQPSRGDLKDIALDASQLWEAASG